MAIPRPKPFVVSILQGVYWFITGIWPFLHLRSFLWVTGPKEDIWLLYTVSVLITVIGGVLLAAGLQKNVTQELKWLGIASAAGLTGIDVYYAGTDVIWDVYLLDAAGELLLILLWLWSGNKDLSATRRAAER